MNQKGFVNILLIVIVTILIGTGVYFVSTRQISLSVLSPTPDSTPIVTSLQTPTPSPISTPISQQQDITLLSPINGGEFLLGTPLKISWQIPGKLPQNPYVFISLHGLSNSSTSTGRIALIPVNLASGEYTWISSSVMVNGNLKPVLGDREYWIDISLYSGNPDMAGTIKVAQDTSDINFTLSYGGPLQETGQLTVTNITPSYGPIGTEITISGTGFTSTKNSVIFGLGMGSVYPNFTSSDGRTIVFTVPAKDNPMCPDAKPCPIRESDPIRPGSYNVGISNANGISNSLVFTVTQPQ